MKIQIYSAFVCFKIPNALLLHFILGHRSCSEEIVPLLVNYTLWLIISAKRPVWHVFIDVLDCWKKLQSWYAELISSWSLCARHTKSIGESISFWTSMSSSNSALEICFESNELQTYVWAYNWRGNYTEPLLFSSFYPEMLNKCLPRNVTNVTSSPDQRTR